MTLPRDIVEFLNASDEEFKRDVSGGGSLVIAKLLKSLYGLKQSARNWHLSLNEFLKDQGFKPVQEVDTCVYMRGLYIDFDLFLILTHVDDLLLIDQGGFESLEEFRDSMKREFKQITYHDENINFLGMVIEQLVSGELLLSQPGYATKICRDEGGSARYKTPGNANLFSEVDDQKVIHEQDVTLFSSRRLMILMFLATRTRPDILKECTFLANFGCNPGRKTIQKLEERDYGYVRDTVEYGII
jgi:hypothetical protein